MKDEIELPGLPVKKEDEPAVANLEYYKRRCDQLEARLSLLESNQAEDGDLLMAFGDACPAGLILCDRDMRVTYANAPVLMYAKALNLGDIVGISIDQIFGSHATQERLAQYHEVMRTGESLTLNQVAIPTETGNEYRRVHVFKVGEGIGFITVDVTAEVKARMDLEDGQQILRQTGRMAQIGGWEHDLRTGMAVWTESLYDILAYPREEPPPGPEQHLSYYPEKDREMLRQAYENAINTGQPFDLELECHRADGQKHWFRAYGEPVYSEGQCIKMRGTFQDVHTQKCAMEEARESEEKYRLLFENAQALITVFDPDGVCVMINRHAARLFYREPEELVGQTFEQLHPENVAEFSIVARRVIEGGEPIEQEVEVTFPAGKRWLLTKIHGMRDSAGDVVALQIIAHDVTDRNLAEKARIESERMFRSVFENAAIGIARVGLDGKWLDVNQRLCEIVGYSREEMLQKTFKELTHPDDLDADLGLHKRILDGEIPTYSMEKRYFRNDQEVVWINLTVGILRNEDNNPINFVAVIEDITDRKQREVELARIHETLAIAQKMARVGYWSFDIATQMPTWSEQMFEIFGVDPANGVPSYSVHRSLMHPEDWEQFDQAVMECYTGMPYNLVIRLIHADHSVHWVNTQGFPRYDENGEITELYGTSQDITHLKRAEEALLDSEQRYRSLVESINVGINVVNPNFELVSVNRRMREWFPDSANRLGEKCYQVFNDPPRDKPCDYCAVVDTLKDGQVHSTVTETPTPDGVRNYRLIVTPLFDQEGNIVSVIETVDDVTEVRRLETEIQKQAKLESIGVLAGGIAHDFNNILTAITGNISLARLECEPETDLAVSLDQALRASERARSITVQLLTFAKGGAPLRQAKSVEAVLRESAAFSLHGSNTVCEFKIDPNLCLTFIDTGQISQVINNLIINADQAMPDGGTITIEADNYNNPGPQSGLPLKAGTYVRVSLSDNGVGIPANYLKRVFDPFFTTKEKGTGLGLTSCYSIIQGHEGHIEVESEAGHGTTFTIYLPISEQGDIAETSATEYLREGHGLILVVDDEEAIRSLAVRILTHQGYEVVAVENGFEALEAYKKQIDLDRKFDVVILDLTIPGSMGGHEALQELKQLDPEVTAVVSSGYSTDPIMSDFEKYGFCARLAKPFRAGELTSVLHGLIGSEVPGAAR